MKRYFAALLLIIATHTHTEGAERTACIDASRSFQSWDGFGASDCWTAAYVGEHWRESREQIASLLFSQQCGAGLSMWRVNLGGGSMKQGEQSGIKDPTRRADSFLDEDGNYDWSRCVGQRYLLDQAKGCGVERIVLFSNSAPVEYTKNGKGHSIGVGRSANLKEECYADFAKYMVDVAKHMRDGGVAIDYISPINEPQYRWADEKQEGSYWRNDQAARIVRQLDSELRKAGLEETKILVNESASWEYLYTKKRDQYSYPSNILDKLFDKASPHYIGDLASIPNFVGAHSYWTDGSWDEMREVRSAVKDAADAKGLRLWQTEWSMLGNHFDIVEYSGHKEASELEIALYMSRVIHNDLTVANVSSWSYWTAIDMERWGHKNRFLLIKVSPKRGDITKEGQYSATKSLWVLGNYSRFIRPEYSRIYMDIEGENLNLFGSAWISPDRKRVVEVYSNLATSAVVINPERKAFGEIESVVSYTTSASKSMEQSNISEEDIILEPQSVTTVTIKLK